MTEANSRPYTFDLVPEELKNIAHWCLFRFKWNEEKQKFSKIPYQVRSPQYGASSTDPAQWSTFADAVKAYDSRVTCGRGEDEGPCDGIGWFFLRPFVGFDLDHCRDKETGEVLEYASTFLSKYATYQELSVSQTGFHGICHGQAPLVEKPIDPAFPQGPTKWVPDTHKGDKTEVYARDRFFVVTGWRTEGSSDEIARLDKATIASIYADARALDKKTTVPSKVFSPLSDEKFREIAEGNWTKYYGSHSEGRIPFLATLMIKNAKDGEIDVAAATLEFEKSGYFQNWPKNQNGGTWPRVQQKELADAQNSARQYLATRRESLDFTDGALLERWSEKAAPTVRYLTDDKSWFVFRAGLWSEHAVGPIFEIREFLKHQEPASGSLDEKAQDRLHHRLNSQKLVAAVKALAPGQPELQHEAREFDPDPLLVGLPEGKVLDLRTGDVRDVAPSDLITRRLPVAPADKISERWLTFLEETHPKQQDVQDFLRRLFGYCLTASTREDVIVFFLGIGGSGKGTTIEPLSALLGPYFLSIPIAMLLEDTNEDRRLNYIAELRGVRLAVCNEGAKMRKLDSRGIKALTGGGEITGRRLGHQPITFIQTHKIVVLANDPPVLELDEAMKQRVLLVKFDVLFRGTADCDQNLREFFRTPEQLAGILRWMIDGCIEWQREGLKPPPSVKVATEEFFQEADFLQQFLDEHVEFTFAGVDFVETKELFGRWTRYCDANGEYKSRGNSKTFLTDIKKRYPEVQSCRNGHGGPRGLSGLRLKQDVDKQGEY